MKKALILCVVLVFVACECGEQNSTGSGQLFTFQSGVSARWASFENPTAAKGAGGTWNKGAKGHAFDQVLAGETKTLMDIQGSGIIQRMWITCTERNEEMMRALKLEMFWDGSETPAVSVPMGDFFGDVLGHSIPFENALFSDPEGRSFNCIIPMPFKTGAKVQLTNTSDNHLRLLFYDINFVLTEHDEDMLYFHASWHREQENELGVDFEILPKVQGKGRFLGSHIGIITNPMYKDTWWGEGEVKVYLDGDTELPTLNGTGAEDYPGSAWGLKAYINQYQGCFLAEAPRFTLYRYHIPDPIFFEEECRVTIQRMGGASRPEVVKIRDEGAELIPVTQGYANDDGTLGLMLLQDMDPVPDVADTTLPNGWMNFYRSDDYSVTALFYLDRPEAALAGADLLQ